LLLFWDIGMPLRKALVGFADVEKEGYEGGQCRRMWAVGQWVKSLCVQAR
jgi:hypothetical protein